MAPTGCTRCTRCTGCTGCTGLLGEGGMGVVWLASQPSGRFSPGWGKKDPDRLDTLGEYADLLSRTGRLEEAEALRAEASAR